MLKFENIELCILRGTNGLTINVIEKGIIK